MSRASDILDQVDERNGGIQLVKKGFSKVRTPAIGKFRPEKSGAKFRAKLAGDIKAKNTSNAAKKAGGVGDKAKNLASKVSGMSPGAKAAVAGGAALAVGGAMALKRRHTLKKAGVIGKGGLKSQKKSGALSKQDYKSKKKEAIAKYKGRDK